jgi:hypothetical protein
VTLEALVPLKILPRRRVLAFVVYIHSLANHSVDHNLQRSIEQFPKLEPPDHWQQPKFGKPKHFHSLAAASNVQGRRNISDTFHLAGWEGDKASAFRVTFLQGDCSKRWRTNFISEKGHGEAASGSTAVQQPRPLEPAAALEGSERSKTSNIFWNLRLGWRMPCWLLGALWSRHDRCRGR